MLEILLYLLLTAVLLTAVTCYRIIHGIELHRRGVDIPVEATDLDLFCMRWTATAWVLTAVWSALTVIVALLT